METPTTPSKNSPESYFMTPAIVKEKVLKAGKELHEAAEGAVETVSDINEKISALGKEVHTLGESLESVCQSAEQIFKPLELITSSIALIRHLTKSIQLRRKTGALPVETFHHKKLKNDVLILFALAGVALSLGAILSTGIGAMAILGGSYVVSTLKASYLYYRTAKKIKRETAERLNLAKEVDAILNDPSPKKDQFHELSSRITRYLKLNEVLKIRTLKQQQLRRDIGLCILSACAFIAAGAFPPLLIPLAASGLGVIAFGAGKKLFHWAQKHYPRFFHSQEKQLRTKHAKKYEILNEMLALATPIATPNRENEVSFGKRANRMLACYQKMLKEQERSKENSSSRSLDSSPESESFCVSPRSLGSSPVPEFFGASPKSLSPSPEPESPKPSSPRAKAGDLSSEKLEIAEAHIAEVLALHIFDHHDENHPHHTPPLDRLNEAPV